MAKTYDMTAKKIKKRGWQLPLPGRVVNRQNKNTSEAGDMDRYKTSGFYIQI